MAYDQHSIESNAGAISHQAWVEKNLDELCSKVDADKVILALACYGYDWPAGKVGKTLTYDNADGNGMRHDVYFTDAATYFNLIRKADDWGLAGIALWRLGSEDARLWSFISRSLDHDHLAREPFDFEKISKIKVGGIQYIGDGEILDLVNSPEPGLVKFAYNPANGLIEDQQYVKTPSNYVIKRFGERDNTVVLTFDDGPDPTYTPEVLDILKREQCSGSIFSCGGYGRKKYGSERKENYINVGEYIDPNDWLPGRTADEIYNEVVKQRDNGNIILLHDAGGNREATIEALPRIIHYFKAHGYKFATIGDLMGKKRDELMPPVQNASDSGSADHPIGFF
ncbi:polysaccharide deacetylase domain-containing protein [Ditylenchus destructor]|uniref:Polysaccharide deacetylase domain-containing protein n=1 Tax=Ditylenchus destructor TaxID=166010 RepID=A0AAD4MGH6_9BILA|nr:polysaccharide deacetylase domain-containing protein [Ditylenchus destructor]